MSMTVTATGTFCFADSASTRSAMFFAMVSKSMVVCFLSRSGEMAVRSSALDSELADVESKAILGVSRLLKPLVQERLDAFLRRWSLDGRHAGVPARSDLDVGRQACIVDEALGVRDRPLVERRDSACKCVDETVELGIGQRTVHVADELGIGATDVI